MFEIMTVAFLLVGVVVPNVIAGSGPGKWKWRYIVAYLAGFSAVLVTLLCSEFLFAFFRITAVQTSLGRAWLVHFWRPSWEYWELEGKWLNWPKQLIANQADNNVAYRNIRATAADAAHCLSPGLSSVPTLPNLVATHAPL